jgi:hypothetical protein
LYFIMAATALASGMVPAGAFSYPFGIISIMYLTASLLSQYTTKEAAGNRHTLTECCLF